MSGQKTDDECVRYRTACVRKRTIYVNINSL